MRTHRLKSRVLGGLMLSLLVGGLATVAVSCADSPLGGGDTPVSAQGSEATPATSPAHAPHVSAPLDLAGVMRRVHFSFRRDDAGSFSGGHTSYEVRTSAGGISVTPGRTDLARDPKTNTLPAEAIGAPAYFETVSIGRGAALHDAPLSEPRVAEDGQSGPSARGRRRAIREYRRGRRAALCICEAARGQGDLVIRVRLWRGVHGGDGARASFRRSCNGHWFALWFGDVDRCEGRTKSFARRLS
ncbi:MAG: hypothetical protein IPM54_39840 [Polyangiaceae bacterium]|nr:hypothetical protein [Polyangiaceae bacterium]